MFLTQKPTHSEEWVFRVLGRSVLSRQKKTMIISMKIHSTKEDIEAVCDRIRHFGYKIQLLL